MLIVFNNEPGLSISLTLFKITAILINYKAKFKQSNVLKK